MDYSTLAKRFKEYLSLYKRVTIISHKRPDGDTIGSALALYNSLKLDGITSELICIDKPPIKYAFLKGFDRYKTKISYNDSLVITLDCAELNRVGFKINNKDIINIDHHKSNANFGSLNIVEVEVSTTAVLFKLLKEGFSINKDVATALYCGLISDSINFTTNLTTKETFIIANELLGYGVDIVEVSNRVNRFNSLAHVRVLARAIESLRLYKDGEVAIMIVTKSDIKATGATYSDIDGVVDVAVSLATVEIAILIVELDDFIKVSLRSKDVDVSKIALHFGGGGHKGAAGFEVKNGKIEQVRREILKELKVYK